MKKKYKWKYKDKDRPFDASCYDCGLEYSEFPDMVLPNEIWEKINPTYHRNAGILCPICILHRLSFLQSKKLIELNDTIEVKFYIGKNRNYKL